MFFLKIKIAAIRYFNLTKRLFGVLLSFAFREKTIKIRHIVTIEYGHYNSPSHFERTDL